MVSDFFLFVFRDFVHVCVSACVCFSCFFLKFLLFFEFYFYFLCFVLFSFFFFHLFEKEKKTGVEGNSNRWRVWENLRRDKVGQTKFSTYSMKNRF